MRRLYKINVTPFQLEILDDLLGEAWDDIVWSLQQFAEKDYTKTGKNVDSLCDKVNKALENAKADGYNLFIPK